MPKAAGFELTRKVRELRQTIARLRRRSSNISEEDTKRILINPLLESLQWDTLDVEEVRSEYRHKSQDNPVDYALFLLRTPCLFVEAKALGKHLEDRKWVAQTIGYAATVGIEWCVLTNGDEYRLYNAHAAVDADDKLFRAVTISEENDESTTIETLGLLTKENMAERRLNDLWKVDFIDKRVKTALDALVSQQDDGLVRLLRKTTTGLSAKDVRASLARALVQVDFPVVPADFGRSEASHPGRRKEAGKGRAQGPGIHLIDLITAGIINPPFAMEATWRKRSFSATILANGEVSFDGKTYSSLSTAGGMARNIVSGPPTDGRKLWQTNGWTFWKYLDPQTGELRLMSDLRDRLRAERK
jgi:predicted type IV restriction endonuclease